MKTQGFLRILKDASVCVCTRVCTSVHGPERFPWKPRELLVGCSMLRAVGSPGVSVWPSAGRDFYL